MAAVRRWTRFRTPGIALYSAITVVALAQTLTACQVNMIAARVSTVQTLTLSLIHISEPTRPY